MPGANSSPEGFGELVPMQPSSQPWSPLYLRAHEVTDSTRLGRGKAHERLAGVARALAAVSTTIIAFHWYFRHQRSEIDLRRDEGEHYEQARGRLSRLTGRDGQPGPPDRDGQPSSSAIKRSEMRGAKGIRKSTVDALCPGVSALYGHRIATGDQDG